jgi:plastocyanin
MLERIWTSLLELTAQFVTPDWSAIIAFLPIVFFLIVIGVLIAVFRRLRKAPPARRGKGRIDPRTPAGIHMPGPSFSPAFAAVGTFLLLLGLVFGGVTLILGAIALVLTLLYWLAEGLRLYDRDIGPTASDLPVVVHEGPPPGVHMPGPSWRPFLGAFGVFLLFLGLVFEGWLLAVGVIALISTLVGWLTDAVQEYRRTVEADATGHLDSGPPPRTPSRLLAALTILAVGAAVLQASVLAPDEASGGGSPTPSAAAPTTAPGSGEPPPASAPAADVTIEAKDIKFSPTTWTGPADRAFTIAFANNDAGTPHNVEIKDGTDKMVFRGDVFNGVKTVIYEVPAQPAGAYKFLCTVHPTMTGTATLQ